MTMMAIERRGISHAYGCAGRAIMRLRVLLIFIADTWWFSARSALGFGASSNRNIIQLFLYKIWLRNAWQLPPSVSIPRLFSHLPIGVRSSTPGRQSARRQTHVVFRHRGIASQVTTFDHIIPHLSTLKCWYSVHNISRHVWSDHLDQSIHPSVLRVRPSTQLRIIWSWANRIAIRYGSNTI